MSYLKSGTYVKLNPEYFRLEALSYNQNPSNRKQWLEYQLINLQASLQNYAVEINSLMADGASLDGVSDVGKWLTTIGGVAVVIPTVVTQIAGAVLAVAGTIVNAVEKGKDSKALRALNARAREIQLEVSGIQTYYNTYTKELQIIKITPYILFGTSMYISYFAK